MDSLTEIVSAFQSADGDINNAITNLADAAGANLSTEVARAISAEGSLDAAKLDLAGGTMSGDIQMGGYGIQGVDGLSLMGIYANPGHDNVGVNTDLNLTNNAIINLSAPTDGGDATNKTYVDDADASIAAELSSEVARAESAEASIAEVLSTEVSSIIANTDLTSIDSFAEVVENLSNEVYRAESAEASIAYDVETIYAKHVTVADAPNDTLTVFNLAVPVKGGSELIYVNGLLQDSEDYTPIYGTGNVVTAVEFVIAPLVGDKVRAYGVYGFVF